MSCWAAGRVIENGVDLARFVPQAGMRREGKVLFIGSFRHFPNIEAFRYLTEEILPLAARVELTVVAGPDAWLHWTHHTGKLRPAVDFRILEFVADVRPLYHEANLVVVPTLESAGTNVKVLEAMAMGRAVISTSSGCAGLGGGARGRTSGSRTRRRSLRRGSRSCWRMRRCARRSRRAGGAMSKRRFDWRAIGLRQRALIRELSGKRDGNSRGRYADDLAAIAAIQNASPEASQWQPASYLDHDCLVAVVGRPGGGISGDARDCARTKGRS